MEHDRTYFASAVVGTLVNGEVDLTDPCLSVSPGQPVVFQRVPSVDFDEEIVAVCNDLANRGVRVIVAGLDMDFKGKPFGPMPALMATAEYVTKVHAVCTHTGNLAHYSFRKAQNDALVLLGEVDEYEPLSRAAYYKALRSQQEKIASEKLESNLKDSETSSE